MEHLLEFLIFVSFVYISQNFVDIPSVLNIYLTLFCFSTFVCPTEIIAFSDRVKEFRDIDTEVIAISCDSQFTHLAW